MIMPTKDKTENRRKPSEVYPISRKTRQKGLVTMFLLVNSRREFWEEIRNSKMAEEIVRYVFVVVLVITLNQVCWNRFNQ